MTRSKDRYSQFDKSHLKNGTKIKYQKGQVSPRVWEGFLDKRGSNLKWELEGCNIPTLTEVIKAKGLSS
tara:strand:- start:290 stop:496 length:207 start_codon:yes stop_codon:yes gene_type:complete